VSQTPAEWWLALEAERYDRTYLNPKPRTTYAPHVTPDTSHERTKRPSATAQRERDNIMFHAGRYSAGATDPEATASFAKMQKLIKGKRPL